MAFFCADGFYNLHLERSLLECCMKKAGLLMMGYEGPKNFLESGVFYVLPAFREITIIF